MRTALIKAIELILSGNREMLVILKVTANMAVTSSLVSLLIGVPVGMMLGACRFRGKSVWKIIFRTLSGMPPVVCGLLFYMLFSGVGPLGFTKLLFTVRIMIIAQVVLITPLVISQMETIVTGIMPQIRETSLGIGLRFGTVLRLLLHECSYHIASIYLLAFSRAIAEVGAVSMVGGAIAWKTNVMTTAIMQYTNRGDFTLGVALGIILMILAFLVNLVVTLLQRRGLNENAK